ncbi:MAG: hypothetical protein SFV53_01755 [Rickettsiales bacterium]|nr:hypothetical protein [Rickettsiales bacterium]
MQKKSFKIFLTLIFCLDFSCRSPQKIPEPYLISTSPAIQDLERQDHKACNSLDLDSGFANKNFSNDLYWHCRLSMAKYRLATNINSTESLNNNAAISELITQISLRLAKTAESPFVKENKRLDERHHQQCVSLGFDFDINDRLKTDQYLLCRKRLIDEEQLDPAYGNDDYLKYSNRFYNLGFVLDNRIDKENRRSKDAENNYPSCLKFFRDNDNFLKCTQAQDQSNQCFATINIKKFKKEAEQKTLCQKQAYLKFPDSFLKNYDQKFQDINRAKTNADAYNKNNFVALGIGKDEVELFESEETAQAEQDEADKQKALEKNINSKKGLYTKYELIRLRQKYIIACQKKAEAEVKKYVEGLEKACQDLGKFDVNEKLI